MAELARLVLLARPEIAPLRVRAGLTWRGLDEAVRLLGALAVGDVAAILLAPAGPGWVFLHAADGGRTVWRPAAVRPGHEALAIGIDRHDVGEAVSALSRMAAGAAGERVAEIPVRLVRPEGDGNGVLTVVAPEGRRPPGPPPGLPHPPLRAHTLERTAAGPLTVTLQWPDVAVWADCMADAGPGGGRRSLLDDAGRHAVLQWPGDGAEPGALSQADADFLAAFLRKGLRAGAFPVDHLDLQGTAGAPLIVRVPFG